VLYLVSCSSTSERMAEKAANFDAFDEISKAIGDEIASSWLSDELCESIKLRDQISNSNGFSGNAPRL
jgi:hypothetical protein